MSAPAEFTTGSEVPSSDSASRELGLVGRLPFLKPGAAEATDRVMNQVAERVTAMTADRARLCRAVL
jgi:hypothetical protein